jgi:hypothetical protein
MMRLCIEGPPPKYHFQQCEVLIVKYMIVPVAVFEEGAGFAGIVAPACYLEKDLRVEDWERWNRNYLDWEKLNYNKAFVGNAGEWEQSYGTIDVGAVFGILTCGKQLNFPSRLQVRRHL